MTYYYELPRVEQMTLLSLATIFPRTSSVNKLYSLKSRVSYSKSVPMHRLSDILVNPDLFPHSNEVCFHNYSIKRAIVSNLLVEPICSNLSLNDVWGFVIEKDRQPLLICQNLEPTDPDRIAVIQVDSLWSDFTIPTPAHPPRVKMLVSAAGFSALAVIVSLLGNS